MADFMLMSISVVFYAVLQLLAGPITRYIPSDHPCRVSVTTVYCVEKA